MSGYIGRSNALLDLSHGAQALVPYPAKGGLTRNPEPGQFVLVGADTSASMQLGGALEQQQAGLELFAKNIREDRLLASTLLVAVTGFGIETPSRVLTPLTPAARFQPPIIDAETGTPGCARIVTEIGLLSQAGRAFGEHLDRDLRPPMAIYVSDGQFGDQQLIDQAIRATRITAVEAGIEVFLVGVGSACDMPFLQRLAQPGRDAIHMRDVTDFRRFFRRVYEWLRQKSQSVMGEELSLPHPFDDDLPPLRAKG